MLRVVRHAAALLCLLFVVAPFLDAATALTPRQRAVLFGKKRFNPKSIAGLKLWFDASDASSITLGTGVSQWSDKSGNANNATQATGSAQPTVATAAQNGRSTLAFSSASSQRLILTSPVNLTSAGYVFLGVIKHPAGNLSGYLGGASGGGSASAEFEWFTDNRIYVGSASGLVEQSSTAQSSAAYNQITVAIGTSSGSILFNGTDISSTTVGVSGRTPIFSEIGHSVDGFCTCNFGEFMIYDRAVHDPTAAERIAAQAYLKSKWATP